MLVNQLCLGWLCVLSFREEVKEQRGAKNRPCKWHSKVRYYVNSKMRLQNIFKQNTVNATVFKLQLIYSTILKVAIAQICSELENLRWTMSKCERWEKWWPAYIKIWTVTYCTRPLYLRKQWCVLTSFLLRALSASELQFNETFLYREVKYSQIKKTDIQRV